MIGNQKYQFSSFAIMKNFGKDVSGLFLGTTSNQPKHLGKKRKIGECSDEFGNPKRKGQKHPRDTERDTEEEICVGKKRKAEKLVESDTTVDNKKLVPFSVQDHPVTYIDTIELLQNLNEHLKEQDAFAFDLEFCSWKTFAGIVCLIQVSTRTRDFIVDCIVLKEEVKLLGSVFQNPQILKVCQGGANDIIWLHKDYDIKVENLFDTQEASIVLNLEGHSLEFLLSNYCEISTDKKFQKADWSIRPLSKDMLQYAQCDSHFLLTIHDMMTSQLKDQYDQVLERSRLITMQKYSPPILKPDDYKKLFKKMVIPASQELAIEALYSWRFNNAKEQDENPQRLLSNKQILDIARKMPRNMQELSECVKNSSPLFNKNIQSILKVIQGLQKKD